MHHTMHVLDAPEFVHLLVNLSAWLFVWKIFFSFSLLLLSPVLSSFTFPLFLFPVFVLSHCLHFSLSLLVSLFVYLSLSISFVSWSFLSFSIFLLSFFLSFSASLFFLSL